MDIDGSFVFQMWKTVVCVALCLSYVNSGNHFYELFKCLNGNT